MGSTQQCWAKVSLPASVLRQSGSLHCDVIGFAEAWWDISHSCSAVVHGLRFIDKDAIADS